MSLRNIRLELARNPQFPEGNQDCGYEFVAPLDEHGRFVADEWRTQRSQCVVRRFWRGEDDDLGRLVHKGRGWAFHYEGMDPDDDEPIFHMEDHRFVVGEYVSITEYDGVMRTFRVVQVK